jgi:TctA family transporter
MATPPVPSRIPLIASRKSIHAEKLPPYARAGVILALAVGTLIAVVLFFVLLRWYNSVPAYPKEILEAGTAQDVSQRLLTNYTTLSKSVSDLSLNVFDVIVQKALLPLFTLIIGYIFGNQTAKQNP